MPDRHVCAAGRLPVNPASSWHPVTVWLIDTRQSADVTDQLATLLDRSERDRVELIAEPAERARFIIAHGAVRLILAELLTVPAASVGWRFGPHGKPDISAPETELRCSLSHSEGLAAFAVTAHRQIGVDLQRRQGNAELGRMAARYYPHDEAQFVQAGRTPRQRAVRFTGLWARKEAGIKAEGGRLVAGLGRPARLPGPIAGSVLMTDPSRPTERYLVRDLVAPAGYHAAVALSGPTPFTVSRRTWTAPTG